MICVNVFQKRVSGFFKSSGFGALVLHNGDLVKGCDPNFFYFTGNAIDNSIAAFTPRSQTLFCSKMNLAQAKETAWMGCEEAGKDALARIGRKAGKAKVGADFNSIPASRYLRWKKKLGGLEDASGKMAELRSIKDGSEVGKIAKAVSITKKIFARAEDELKPSKTESEIAKYLIISSYEMGCEPAFEPIVAAGINSRFPHHRTSGKKLGSGVVLIDYGVKFEGYCADLTRCYFLGACKKEKEAYEASREIFSELCNSMHKFKTGGAIAAAAAKLQSAKKLPRMPHSIGHGLGIEVHESPSLRKKSKARVQAGNVLALEPSAYFPKFGVRFEEDVLILSNGRARIL